MPLPLASSRIFGTLLATALAAAVLLTGVSAEAAPKGKRTSRTLISTTSTTATLTPATPARTMQLGLTTGCCTPAGVALTDQVPGYGATGADWVRTGFDWRNTEKVRGSYTWSRDGIVSAFRAEGMQVLGVLAYSPSWAVDPACHAAYGGKCAPTDPADFARFAAAAAERYDGDGIADAPGSPVVHAWEIWNEPNLAGFWRPSPDPAAYTRLLAAATKAVRAAAPSATVVSAGLSPAGGSFAPVEFLRAMYAAGAAGSFDALGFHPYTYPAAPAKLASWNAWQQMLTVFPSIGQPDSLRSLMVANGDGNKQIWATEYGAPTGGDTNRDGASTCDADGVVLANEDRCVTEQRQADLLTEAVALWQSYSWSGPLFVYSFQDLQTGAASLEGNFGLVRTDGTPKPAHAAFVEAVQSLR